MECLSVNRHPPDEDGLSIVLVCWPLAAASACSLKARTGMSSMVKVRSRRMSRVKANHQPNSAPMRLRQPVRKPMWMNSQATQPMKPPKCSFPVETTARPRAKSWQPVQAHHVPGHRDVGMAGDGQVRLDAEAARPV